MPLAEEREATALVNAWLYVAFSDGEIDESEQETLDERIAELYPVLPEGAFARMFGKAIVTAGTSEPAELLELIAPASREMGERLLTNLVILAGRNGGLDDEEKRRFHQVARACGYDTEGTRALCTEVAREHDLHPETLAPQSIRPPAQ